MIPSITASRAPFAISAVQPSQKEHHQRAHQPIASTPPASETRFSGLTHNLRGRHWLDAPQLRRLIQTAPTPYVGNLPKAWVHWAPQNPKQIYHMLDELAPILRTLGKGTDINLEFRLKQSQSPIQLDFIGHGSYGSVYRLKVGGQSFALKVYHRPEEAAQNGHGAYAECATGLFFSDKPRRDIAQFFFANPQAGWSVGEFIAPTMSAETRPGPAIRDNTQIKLGDDRTPNNINSIRIDWGGIYPVPVQQVPLQNLPTTLKRVPKDQQTHVARVSLLDTPPEKRMEAFTDAFHAGEPHIQQTLISLIRHLPNSEDRLTAFEMAMKTNQTDVQAQATLHISELWIGSRFTAFQQALATRHPQVQSNAMTQIPYLANDVRQAALQEGLNNPSPEVQKAAARQLGELPVDERYPVFQDIMKSDQAEVQAIVAGKLLSLPTSALEDACLKVLESPHPQVQAALLKQLPQLAPHIQEKALAMGLSSSNPLVQSVLPIIAPHLSLQQHQQIFEWAMQTQEPAIQARAAQDIHRLPRASRYEAFQMAMQTQNTEIQTEACHALGWLPEEFIPHALTLVMKTGNPSLQLTALQQVKHLDTVDANAAMAQFIEHYPLVHLQDVKMTGLLLNDML